MSLDDELNVRRESTPTFREVVRKDNVRLQGINPSHLSSVRLEHLQHVMYNMHQEFFLGKEREVFFFFFLRGREKVLLHQ